MYTRINAKDKQGHTALHIAALKGLPQVCFAILSHMDFSKAHAEATVDGSLWTATELAVGSGHVKLAVYIYIYIIYIYIYIDIYIMERTT